MQDARCLRVLGWNHEGDRHGCLWEASDPWWLLPLGLQLQLLTAELGSLWFCRADRRARYGAQESEDKLQLTRTSFPASNE